MIVFMLASFIPKLLVEPPQYDFIFSSDQYNSSDSGIYTRLFIENKKLYAEVDKSKDKSYYYDKRLFRYYAKSNAVKEISISLPSLPDGSKKFKEIIPETSTLELDKSLTSPDGFQLKRANYNSGISGVFFGSRGRRDQALSRNGVNFTIPFNEGSSYRRSFFLLGWIIKD